MFRQSSVVASPISLPPLYFIGGIGGGMNSTFFGLAFTKFTIALSALK